MLAKFPAEHVWSSTAEYGTKAFSNFVKYANEQGRAIEIPSPGDTFTLGEAEITVLGPLRDYENNNENSIVLRVDYGETSFLFTGDMGITAEDRAGRNPARGWTRRSSRSGITAAPDRRAMSSCARSCRTTPSSPSARTTPYGHPTEAALSRLRDADTQVFRTDLQGVIHAVSDGRSVTFETERSATEAQLNPTIHDAAETYIGNVNSQIFHVSTCHSCPSEKNAVRFASVWDAMARATAPIAASTKILPHPRSAALRSCSQGQPLVARKGPLYQEGAFGLSVFSFIPTTASAIPPASPAARPRPVPPAPCAAGSPSSRRAPKSQAADAKAISVSPSR